MIVIVMGKHDAYYSRIGKWVSRGVPLPIAVVLATESDEEVAQTTIDITSEISPLSRAGVEAVGGKARPAPGVKKAKGKVSAYNREYKKQFAKLKKKHPKTAFKTLVKRAHTATKKVMRK